MADKKTVLTEEEMKEKFNRMVEKHKELAEKFFSKNMAEKKKEELEKADAEKVEETTKATKTTKTTTAKPRKKKTTATNKE